MSSALNFTDWTREQKEEYAKKRMTEMKLKNEKMKQRYAEVEQDRIAAEEHNSAITSVSKVIPKKEKSDELVDAEIRTEYTREWDRGKPDKEHWKSPEHHASYKNYRTSHFEKKSDRKDNWRNYSRNENKDQYRYDHGSDSVQSRRMKGNYSYKHDSDQPNVSNSFHPSPKKTRVVEHQNSELQWKSQHSYVEKYKMADYSTSNSTKYSNRDRSSGISDVDYVDNLQISIKASLWQNDKISEDQNKQNRVERWVKSVNKSNNWTDKQLPQKKQKSKISSKPCGKFGRFEHSSDQSSGDEYVKYSQRDTKSQKNTPKIDSCEIKQHNRAGTDRSESINTNQNNVKKFYKNTYNSQYSGSNRNENLRKQKFDKGMKNSREMFNKSKMEEKSSAFNDGRNNSNFSRLGSRKLGLYSTPSNFSRDTTCYKNDDDGTWSNIDKSNKNDDDGTWGNVDKSNQNDDDGTWANVAKSNRNDDDDGTWGNVAKSNRNDDGTWSNVTKSNQNDDDGWGSVAVSNQNDDGMWGNTEQSDIQWKLSDDDTDTPGGGIHNQKYCSNKNKVQCVGWEEYESSNDLLMHVLKENNDVKSNEGNVSLSELKTPIDKTASISTVKPLSEKIQNDSDDGGWSTVSEEVEIHWNDDMNHEDPCKRKHVA